MLLEGEAEERREEAGLVWAGPEGWGISRRTGKGQGRVPGMGSQMNKGLEVW